jgi:hypothetical protein
VHARRAGERHVAHPHVSHAHRLAVPLVLPASLVLIVGGVAYGGAVHAATSTTTLTVYPRETTLTQFTTMDVWAGGIFAGAQVVIMMGNTQIVSGTADSSGRYVSGDVPVPAGVAACGQNEVDWYTDHDFVASAEVTVYCPAVQVSPNQFDSGGGADSFTVTGTGYPPDRDVVFTIDNAQSGFDNVFTDANGAFAKATSHDALPCGPHQLTATGQPPEIPQWFREGPTSTVSEFQPLPASAAITVAGCATPPPVGRPKIAANPVVITDGTLTHVTGTGFRPGEAVTLEWETTAGAALSQCSPDAVSAPPLSADAQGNIDTYCLAEPHEVLGAVRIVALPAHVAAPVVVEGGSMQPSSSDDQFVFRR